MSELDIDECDVILETQIEKKPEAQIICLKIKNQKRVYVVMRENKECYPSVKIVAYCNAVWMK